MKIKIELISIFTLISVMYSCKKLVEIPPPTNSISSSQVFATDAQATQAIAGVYFKMINLNAESNAFSGGLTIYSGASADELKFYNETIIPFTEFFNNSLLSNNGSVFYLWNTLYSTIYGCNSVVEGLQAAHTVHDSVKMELTGEAEFVRALANFYLVNLFGKVPLVTTIDYNKTSLLVNSPVVNVYAAIIADLNDAASKLPSDYSVGQGQRTIPNKWAAIALLARVYLYQDDWANAEKESSLLINNTGLYSLSSLIGASEVFSANSTEAIWQLQQSNQTNFNGATPEGNAIIPVSATSFPPSVYMTPILLAAFEKGDQRRFSWVDSTTYGGVSYYYPYKYKVRQGVFNEPYTEYYMVLRLAEQYLIRAEAEAQGAGNGLSGAITDLNTIRNRAGLPNYAGASDQTSVLDAIYHEDQIEFFAEWGHRWLDLKRRGTAVQVLSTDKGFAGKSDQLLYPIPLAELQKDPNLVQNPGY